MDHLQNLGRDLSTLAIFRALSSNPVIQGLQSHLLACGQGGNLAAYTQAIGELYASGTPSLARYIHDLILEDENPFIEAMGAQEPIAESIEYSLERELAVLQRLADMTPEDFSGNGALWDVASVPGFEVELVPLAYAYWEHAESIGVRGFGIYAHYHAFKLAEDAQVVPVRYPDPIRLNDLVGYEQQQNAIVENTKALLQGLPAANILISGDAGTGKSSTIKAVANEFVSQGLRIIEVQKNQLYEIPELLDVLRRNPLKFIIFIDDLSFASHDDNFTALKAILEGSLVNKSDRVVIYATSNRRHLVRERHSDRDGDDVHRRDTMQEIISLSDRFGLHISMYKPNKETYLHIVHMLADKAGIRMDKELLDLEAERFVTRRAGRSARAAHQFVDALRVREEQH